MKILVGCECSGVVRESFRAIGHEAWSCDLKPAEDDSPFHFEGDIFGAIRSDEWDLGIFHPPCDYLTVSGNAWFSDGATAGEGILTGEARRKARVEAVRFVNYLWSSPIERVAIENPIGRLATMWRPSSQTIQPWMFWDGEKGKGEVKATCLWLKNLPLLSPTTPFETGRVDRLHRLPPGPTRKLDRSVTFTGIAKAMADQWSKPYAIQQEMELLTA